MARAPLRTFRVGGGLVVIDNQMLLAANRRRQGTLEWTPPGGVIDEGESVAEGISREVREETGLHVPAWEACHYTVTVTAPDMGWEMMVESWFARTAHGAIELNDPDRIVEQALFVDLDAVEPLLAGSPPWVRIPILAWISSGLQPIAPHAFHVSGAERASAHIEHISP